MPAAITKREFLQLAGLAIAPGIAANPVYGQTRDAADGRRVIVVTFGGGVRYSETFAPEGLHNIPRLAAMRPHGYFFRTCINDGVLSHFNSTASILTGNWQRVDDFGFQPPAGPTLFEAFRKGSKTGPMDAWVVATNKSFASIAPNGANVVLPKQLL